MLKFKGEVAAVKVHHAVAAASSPFKPFEHIDQASSIVKRNPAPDSSPPAPSSGGKTFTVPK
jgi:hypothetical protein